MVFFLASSPFKFKQGMVVTYMEGITDRLLFVTLACIFMGGNLHLSRLSKNFHVGVFLDLVLKLLSEIFETICMTPI